jgi:deoxyribonuclease V
MHIEQLHSWDISAAAAVKLQKELAQRVDTLAPLGEYRRVAGADVSYNRFSDIMYAAVVVLRADDAAVIEVQYAVRETQFPYVPGLLSFREAPALLEAFGRVQNQPDVVLFDGQGIAHPRRIGIAAHLGLFLETPTVGCGKSLLCGEFKEPGPQAGDLSPLKSRTGDIIGQVVRTKDHVKPIFVSPGHRIDLGSAVRVALEMCRGYRLPEPTRLAHQYVNEARRRGESKETRT